MIFTLSHLQFLCQNDVKFTLIPTLINFIILIINMIDNTHNICILISCFKIFKIKFNLTIYRVKIKNL